ncbi:imidazolonepropionase [Chondromyces crocatus]|uniref:Imidazolonepropionase n=1 Tax=Chondromyces crocatus TaxID=52 RepID=A0A0K1EK86_CHOCO|nr:imidazolonepropionase [Chondromyces crocatus]AKT41072.1 imidazolonepropionase [Chondromyces crocatus]
MSAARFVIVAPRVITCDPARTRPGDPLGVVEDGAVLVEDGVIRAVGARAELLGSEAGGVRVHAVEGVVTPGLVDAHTHAPWMGSRDAEYAVRLAGGDYEAIAAAGGGIVSTMRAVRASSVEALSATLVERLRRMATLGVTTVEAKSGYGLDEASERRQLEAVAEAGRDASLPRLVPTYLALHAVPPEAHGDRSAYARQVAERWLPAIAAAGLCRYVDAYVDRSAFSVEDTRPLLARARDLGLGVRLHAGQFADVGAAELAAEFGAASADHLEQVGPAGIEALAARGVAAALLPLASFTLRQAPPPVDALRAAGVPLVVASDANPGTAPTESLPLAMAFAARLYGLTVAEVLLGATREAARTLGLEASVGVLRPGLQADLVAWDLPHENALIQPWGCPRTRMVLRGGALLSGRFDASPPAG